jgi:hypothetical protein
MSNANWSLQVVHFTGSTKAVCRRGLLNESAAAKIHAWMALALRGPLHLSALRTRRTSKDVDLPEDRFGGSHCDFRPRPAGPLRGVPMVSRSPGECRWAAGNKKRGGWQKQTAGGTEVLVQELIRHGDLAHELGFYYAFMIGRRYVSILAVGPEANRKELRQAAATLRIEPNPVQ